MKIKKSFLFLFIAFFSSCSNFSNSNSQSKVAKKTTVAIVLSGPSGVGKTTVADKLEENYNVYRVISFTSRDKRENEINGIDYQFISPDQCGSIKKLNLLDFAENYGNCYGIVSSQIQTAIDEGQDLLFNVSSAGLKSILNDKRIMKDVKIISVFLDVDRNTLKSRLEKRGTDSSEEIAKRLSNYDKERSEMYLYSNIIDASKSVDEVYAEIEKIYLKYAS